MKQNKDFKIVDSSRKNDHISIKILTGPYSGVSYSYSKVRFIEEGEYCRVSYSYEIESSPDLPSGRLREDPGFQKVSSDVLNELLEEYASKK